MTRLLGHSFPGPQDLPIPRYLFYYGGALVLFLSFIALGALWTTAKLDRPRERRAWRLLERTALSKATRIAGGLLGFSLWALVTVAALVGDSRPLENIAPTFVYVVFWLGLPLLVVLLGNFWPLVNPWKAAADAVAWAGERAGIRWTPPFRYPERLGCWPAAVLLFAFAALELAYVGSALPRAVGVAICLYSWITWIGMLAVGRRAWLRGGEAFNVYFWLLGHVAPVAVRRGPEERRLVLRPPFSALAEIRGRAGLLPFVSVMLGAVAFDGLSRTRLWQDLLYEVATPHVISAPALADALISLVNLGGLLLGVLFVALTYAVAMAGAARMSQKSPALRDVFLASLVPIALAYLVAHYFSYFVLQGQFVIRLISDPFGWGWNLFGTRDYDINLQPVTPAQVWYVQVVALVAGHVIALVLAHDRAVSLTRAAQAALRTQYAMLSLMVLYTVGGMWILSR